MLILVALVLLWLSSRFASRLSNVCESLCVCFYFLIFSPISLQSIFALLPLHSTWMHLILCLSSNSCGKTVGVCFSCVSFFMRLSLAIYRFFFSYIVVDRRQVHREYCSSTFACWNKNSSKQQLQLLQNPNDKISGNKNKNEKKNVKKKRIFACSCLLIFIFMDQKCCYRMAVFTSLSMKVLLISRICSFLATHYWRSFCSSSTSTSWIISTIEKFLLHLLLSNRT